MRPPRRMKASDENRLTGMIGAVPRSPPNSTVSPTSRPGTGMMRAALLHRVREERERGGRPVRARALEPKGLDDLRDRVAGHGRRREAQVNDAEADSQTPRGLAPDEFARARELEGEPLDELRHLV